MLNMPVSTPLVVHMAGLTAPSSIMQDRFQHAEYAFKHTTGWTYGWFKLEGF